MWSVIHSQSSQALRADRHRTEMTDVEKGTEGDIQGVMGVHTSKSNCLLQSPK